MTVPASNRPCPASIDPALPWIEQIHRAEPDLLRSMMRIFMQSLMAAEADAIYGAPYGSRTEERVNTRNVYRPREWDTGSARWSSRSPSCDPGLTSRTGCSSAGALNGP